MKQIKILAICYLVASVSFVAMAQDSVVVAQHAAIDRAISKELECRCNLCPDEEIIDDDEYYDEYAAFKQDLVYSMVALQQYRHDTLLCAKKMGQYLTIRLFYSADTSNYDIVFQHCLQYARDTSFHENDYNSIVNRIRRSVMSKIKLPTSVLQFIGSPEFYKATTDNLPLLLSYMDKYEEVENLRQWGKTHLLNERDQMYLTISLARLGDSIATKEYVAWTPTDSRDWETYITGLNYARTQEVTKRLIDLLDNKTKIEYYRYIDSESEIYYTTVASYALEELSKIMKDFPIEVKIPYEKDLFSVVPKKVMKQAKQWFKDNPDYKIIRKSDYNY